MFERFNIEVMCTTDAATDTLTHHQTIRDSDWKADIRPTFRPDAVVDLLRPGWQEDIGTLSAVSGITVNSYGTFIQALEQRRTFFKQMGATATDHAAVSAYTAELSLPEAAGIFQRALRGEATPEDAYRVFMATNMDVLVMEDVLLLKSEQPEGRYVDAAAHLAQFELD